VYFIGWLLAPEQAQDGLAVSRKPSETPTNPLISKNKGRFFGCGAWRRCTKGTGGATFRRFHEKKDGIEPSHSRHSACAYSE
jgi:hypothetical protein